MSIWYDGTNLNMYRGDSGSIVFRNLPCCIGYRVYFSVKSELSNEIIFECAGDPEFYFINNDGVEYERLEDESYQEYLDRLEPLVESGEAIRRAKCRIFISSDKTEKLFVLKGETERKYYYGLKICFASTGVENTLIPQTVRDKETGKIIFQTPPELIVKPKYTEGIMPFSDYDEIEVARQDPADYGLQPLITPVMPLKWQNNWELAFDKKMQEAIEEAVTLKDDVALLKATVGDQDKGLVHDVIELGNQVASYSSTIALIQNNLTEVQTEVTNISETVDVVVTDVAEAVAKVNNMEETVNELSQRVAANTSNISVLQVAVADSVEIVTNMKVTVDEMQETVNRVEGDMFQLSTTVNSMQSTVNRHNEEIQDLRADFDSLGDMAWEYGEDWQRKLEPGDGIIIDEDNVISVSYNPTVKLSDLTDVLITDLQDSDILVYDGSLRKWVNKQYTPGPTPPTPGDDIDGGHPDSTYDTILDGGHPNSTYDSSVDGGHPDSSY